MSAGHSNADGSSEDKFGLVVTVFALAISMVVTASLVSLNLSARQKLQAAQRFATEAPPSGALLGQSALDGSEWEPNRDDENNVNMVLFVADADGRIGDMEFWRDIATQARVAAPELQFVGLCTRNEKCHSPGSAAERAGSTLTLLRAMDPIQMHALRLAGEQAMAFVYRGSSVKRVSLRGDRKVLVSEIVETVQKGEVSGT